MKKVIPLLFLAISFVLMVLISYMKFQSALYFDSANYNNKKVIESVDQDHLPTDAFHGYSYY